MSRAWLAVIAVVALGRTAHADVTELTVNAHALPAALTDLVEQHDEPVGLVARDDSATLGLLKGDLVRAINGQSATRSSILIDGGAIFYLDVLRGTQPVVVRLAVTLDGAENSITRDRYKDRVQQLERFGDLVTNKNHTFVQVTKGGIPSGIMVQSSWVGFGALNEGDVIRNIDGVDISTIDQAVEAFARGAGRKEIAISIERLGQPLVKTLHIEDSLNPDPTVADPTTAPGPSRAHIALSLLDAGAPGDAADSTRCQRSSLTKPLARQLTIAFAGDIGRYFSAR